MPVSVLILTLDEAVNLADCLASVAWSDDVVVLDSGSTDRTRELAAAGGARVVVRPFDDYASQRNFGLGQIEYRHPWILMLDADERVPEELVAEIGQAVAGAGEELALFYLRRRDHLFGRWIRRSSGYPTWFGRLVRRGRVHVERAYNEQSRADGASRQLAGHLDHYPFNKGFAEWMAKHNRYSSMEAELLERQRSRPAGESLFDRDPVVRRRVIKELVYRLPARPALVFLALYLLRGGFLEGRAGLTFCLLRAWYEFMIDCKRRELARRARNLPV